MANTPAQKMEVIQTIFRDVQENFPDRYTLQTLAEKLDSYEIEFRSIAYEAASFCIALKDLDTTNDLLNWKSFLIELGKPHATQIHVGLGWALAQKHIDPISFLSQLEPMMRYRVLDGYGYYEGIFRRRKSVLSQQKFETKDDVASCAYDQGLGRSLWYSNRGVIDDVKNVIEKFTENRRKDLWRGVGIAVVYVGGCSEEMLKDILQNGGANKKVLLVGAAMALISRHRIVPLETQHELVCRCLFKCTVEMFINKVEMLDSELAKSPSASYTKLLEEIERITEQPC